MSVRVYEIAREAGMPAKEAVARIRELGIDVKSHSSTVDEETAREILERLTGGEAAGETGSGTPEAAAVETVSSESAGEAAPAETAPAEEEAEETAEEAGEPPAEEEAPAPEEQEGPPILKMKPPIVVRDLAAELDLKPNQLITELMMMNVLASINQPIEPEIAVAICHHHGRILEVERRRPKPPPPPKEPEPVEEEEVEEEAAEEAPSPEGAAPEAAAAGTEEAVAEGAGAAAEVEAPPARKKRRKKKAPVSADAVTRPPVVTFMGHVDHGKTSLLDRIRHTRVTASEAGGITQHIGAYQVETPGGLITFIDTPGHEAFTRMRARGAQVTDIAVLVIAADDGIMPQTVEAINHARAADVPILVALNKIDLPAANPDRVKQQLQAAELTPEDWGGETIVVPVSAETGEGIDELLEMILLQAEIMELKAVPKGPASGVVIESRISRGTGPVATVLVNEGELRLGDPILAGPYWGKVRTMTDEKGQRLKTAGPATPVLVSRLSGVPDAGETFRVVESERKARAESERLLEEIREGDLQHQRRVSLDDLFRQIEEEGRIELPLVVKADTQGSVEAVVDSILSLTSEKIAVKIIHSSVGNVTENDVELAGASDALVLGFQVKVDSGAERAAKRLGVEIRLYRVIYELVDDVQKAMRGRLQPETREIVVAHAEVRQIFPIRGGGHVAGCIVTDGAVRADARVRVLRGGEVVFDGSIHTLRRFKDEVREVRAGQDCGIRLDGFDDVREGDVIETYRTEEVAAEL